jgi:hypothetical protein
VAGQVRTSAPVTTESANASRRLRELRDIV